MGGQESKTRNRDEYTASEHIRKIDTAVKDLSKSIDGLFKEAKDAGSSSVVENDYVVVEVDRSITITLPVANIVDLDGKKLTLLQELKKGATFITNTLKNVENLQDLWIKSCIKDEDKRPEVALRTKSESSHENKTHEQTMHSNEFLKLEDNYNRTEQELRKVKIYLDETAKDMKEENQTLKKKIEQLDKEKAKLAEKLALMESQRQAFDEGFKHKHEKDKKTVECEQENVVSNEKRKDAGLKHEDPENQQQLETCNTIPVQIFCRKKGGLTATISTKLKELLKDKFKGRRNCVTITTPETIDEIQDNQRLLVVCMHGSRLGTDTGNEIQGIKDLGRTALLIFHHKDLHALPNQASARVLTETSFKELGGIFDFAFLADKGIYECGMNNESANGVMSFISRAVQK